jgi:hypothetical protein
MAEMQMIFGDDELALGIEDDEVGVVSSGDAPFAICAAGEVCGSFGHPTSDVG